MMKLLLSPLIVLLNKAVALDQQTTKRLQDFSGKTIQITLQPFALDYRLELTATGFMLLDTTDTESAADVHLTGTPIALLKALSQGHQGATHNIEDVDIQGDMELVQQLNTLLAQFTIDWEEQLSHLTGDVIAHQVGTQIQHGKQYLTQLSESCSSNISEYLQEESRQLPSQLEVKDFMHDIDTLRMDVDRLNARITRLQQYKKEDKCDINAE